MSGPRRPVPRWSVSFFAAATIVAALMTYAPLREGARIFPNWPQQPLDGLADARSAAAFDIVAGPIDACGNPSQPCARHYLQSALRWDIWLLVPAYTGFFIAASLIWIRRGRWRGALAALLMFAAVVTAVADMTENVLTLSALAGNESVETLTRLHLAANLKRGFLIVDGALLVVLCVSHKGGGAGRWVVRAAGVATLASVPLAWWTGIPLVLFSGVIVLAIGVWFIPDS